MPDTHANELHNAYTRGRDIIIWVALILLIKGHLDQHTQIQFLRTQKTLPSTISAPILPITIPDSAFNPSDGLGNLHVYGSLIVDGCISWRQSTGNYQNSCLVYTELLDNCVHGTPTPDGCLCTGPFTGPLCDKHTCFNRGLFDVTRGSCTCLPPFTDISMCEDIAVPLSDCTFDGQNCQGTCVLGQCICTRPGQLGRLCQQCAYPLINTTLCPGRTNWGLDYINIVDKFAVCGGGYEFASSDIVTLRGLNCQTSTCIDFYTSRHKCCTPFALASNCQLWQNWTYNRADFPPLNTVFNSFYAQRYLQIVNEHDPVSSTCEDSNACLLRAHAVLQSNDWPLLALFSTPNRPFTIRQDAFYLSIQNPGQFAAAIFSLTPFFIYLIDTGLYYKSQEQFKFIFYYDNHQTYCLADTDADPLTQHVLGIDTGQQLYWIHLQDQPGAALPPNDYCGKFLTTMGLRRLGLNAYPGSRNQIAMWFADPQNVIVVEA